MSNKKIALELLSGPGDTIQEILDENGNDKRWLADQLDISGNQAWKLLKNELFIDRLLMAKLAHVFKIDFSYWYNRQKLFREKRIRIKRL